MTGVVSKRATYISTLFAETFLSGEIFRTQSSLAILLTTRLVSFMFLRQYYLLFGHGGCKIYSYFISRSLSRLFDWENNIHILTDTNPKIEPHPSPSPDPQ